MACTACGSKESKSIKHLPLPNGENGWITLSNWTDYCVACAKKAGIKANEAIEKAKESVTHG